MAVIGESDSADDFGVQSQEIKECRIGRSQEVFDTEECWPSEPIGLQLLPYLTSLLAVDPGIVPDLLVCILIPLSSNDKTVFHRVSEPNGCIPRMRERTKGIHGNFNISLSIPAYAGYMCGT